MYITNLVQHNKICFSKLWHYANIRNRLIDPPPKIEIERTARKTWCFHIEFLAIQGAVL